MNKRTTARRKITEKSVDLSPHERLCSVCSHPQREAIEEAFLHWRTIVDLDGELLFPSIDSIYRHAHALGLFKQRSRNLRYALENIIAGSETAPATADSVIRAIRACACLKDNGQWVDPPTTHRVIVKVTRGDAHPPVPLLSLPSSSSESLESSAAPPELEDGLENNRENALAAAAATGNDDPARIGIPSERNEPRDREKAGARSRLENPAKREGEGSALAATVSTRKQGKIENAATH